MIGTNERFLLLSLEAVLSLRIRSDVGNQVGQGERKEGFICMLRADLTREGEKKERGMRRNRDVKSRSGGKITSQTEFISEFHVFG